MLRRGIWTAFIVVPAVVFIYFISIAKIEFVAKFDWHRHAGNSNFFGNIVEDKGQSRQRKDRNSKLMKIIDDDSKSKSFGSFVVSKGKGSVRRAIEKREKVGVQTPVILKWNTRRHAAEDDELLGAQCGGCLVTMDKQKWNDSVAVVFFIQRTKEILPDPKIRSEQVYVFRSIETPSKLISAKPVMEDPKFDSIFNLTMNFRRDADIIQYSGNRELALRWSLDLIKQHKLHDILHTKSKLAVWYVSNCYHTPGALARMRYVMKLVQAGLKLDKFGECFTQGHKSGSVKGQIHEYKFYLAFENSIHCPSYVSEKFWRNALDGTAVPIVFGPTKEDMEAIAPPKSYIHVEDFKSPAELVKYINYLDSNLTAYLEYHKWRYQSINTSLAPEDISKDISGTFCRLCRRQVLEEHPPKSIPSISKWMFGTNYVDDECLTPKYKLNESEKSEMSRFFARPNSYDTS